MTWGFGVAIVDAISALKFATGDAVIGDAVIGDADSAVKFDMAAISSARGARAHTGRARLACLG